jgi:hypothetical protein
MDVLSSASACRRAVASRKRFSSATGARCLSPASQEVQPVASQNTSGRRRSGIQSIRRDFTVPRSNRVVYADVIAGLVDTYSLTKSSSLISVPFLFGTIRGMATAPILFVGLSKVEI